MGKANAHILTSPDAPLSFHWRDVKLVSRHIAPAISAFAGRGGKHRFRWESDFVLAGMAGRLTTDEFEDDGLEFRREVWVGEAGAAAIRHSLINRTEQPLELPHLTPLCCDGTNALRMAGCTAGGWDVLRQSHMTEEIPTAFRPGVLDADFALASGRLTAYGERKDIAIDPDAMIQSDSFILFRVRGRDHGPHLLIGFVGAEDHLTELRFQTQSAGESLARLAAFCHFDDCQIPPGRERSSAWIYLTVGNDASGLVAEYAERVGLYHRVPSPPRNAPSVWCSWYYYGPSFSQADLDDVLAELGRRPFPCDVILIDMCWEREFGDLQANDRWADGMKRAADRIARTGYRPGLWTCPYLAGAHSAFATKHPQWLLRRKDGESCRFEMMGDRYVVIDPTHPDALADLERRYRRIAREWGFTYHKLDFMRSVFLDPGSRFHDQSATRVQAYRRGLETIRRSVGKESYVCVCGGHYLGSIGLADAQRSGNDALGIWNEPPTYPSRIKQNMLRTWMGRLWHGDPDAAMIRRNDRRRDDSVFGRVSLGKLTNEEVTTALVNQYVGGGVVCFTENFSEIAEDRRALYRHVLPSINRPAVPVDLFHAGMPTLMLTTVQPRAEGLAPWTTVSVLNVEDTPVEREFIIADPLLPDRRIESFLLFEFFTQRVWGVFRRGDPLRLEPIPPHASRVIRIAPWPGDVAVLAGTDLHLSGGGVEIARWQADEKQASFVLDTRWTYPVRVTVAFPGVEQPVMREILVGAGAREHRLHRGRTHRSPKPIGG